MGGVISLVHRIVLAMVDEYLLRPPPPQYAAHLTMKSDIWFSAQSAQFVKSIRTFKTWRCLFFAARLKLKIVGYKLCIYFLQGFLTQLMEYYIQLILTRNSTLFKISQGLISTCSSS